MLKIEVIKFEAQDVITASPVVVGPMIPLQPATPVYVDGCTCDQRPAWAVHTENDHGLCDVANASGLHKCGVARP